MPERAVARVASLLAVLVVTGCTAFYDPPMTADHASPKYRSDLVKCRKQADIVAERISGQTPVTEIRSWFTSSEPERQNIRTCMQSKGYSA